MPEETGTVEQSHESTTETTQPTTSIFDELDEQEQSSTEQAVDETEQAVEAESVEGDTEGEDSNWLPSEQLKVFPPDVLARYAKRFGLTIEEISADTRLANLVSKAINSDIHIEAQKKAEEEAANEPEEVAEAVEPTAEEAAALQTQREQKLTEFVHQITDKSTAVKFTQRLATADKIEDPEQRSVAVAEALTLGMANVFPDIFDAYFGGPGGKLEQMIGNYINANLPGLSESTQQTMRAQTVDRVASTNPKFAALNLKFGTPEFMAAAERAAKILPGMETVPLPFEQKVKMMFNLLTNAPGAVANATAAIEKGKEVERDSKQRKTNATLGAGHSKGLAAKTTGNDDLFGAPGEIQISQRLIGKQS